MAYAQPVLENEMHKIFWDFKIKTDHQISATQRDLIIINRKPKKTKDKENLQNC